LGALGKNEQLITCQNEVFDAVSFQKFLQKLIAEAQDRNNSNGRRRKILLILDKYQSEISLNYLFLYFAGNMSINKTNSLNYLVSRT
jgi:hypothetical protein